MDNSGPRPGPKQCQRDDAGVMAVLRLRSEHRAEHADGNSDLAIAIYGKNEARFGHDTEVYTLL